MGFGPTVPVLQTGNLPLVDPAVQLLHQLRGEPPPSPPNLGRSIHAKATRSSWHLGPSRPLLARFQGGRACHVPNSSTQRREGESNSRSAHRDSLSFPSWHLTTRSSLHGGAGASRTPMADLSDQPAFEAGGLATCPTAPGAGREGIEPSYPDLEFGVLPLNERPRSGTREN